MLSSRKLVVEANHVSAEADGLFGTAYIVSGPVPLA